MPLSRTVTSIRIEGAKFGRCMAATLDYLKAKLDWVELVYQHLAVLEPVAPCWPRCVRVRLAQSVSFVA
jgi:hypothetical protein